jgi:hypothetical protein
MPNASYGLTIPLNSSNQYDSAKFFWHLHDFSLIAGLGIDGLGGNTSAAHGLLIQANHVQVDSVSSCGWSGNAITVNSDAEPVGLYNVGACGSQIGVYLGGCQACTIANSDLSQNISYGLYMTNSTPVALINDQIQHNQSGSGSGYQIYAANTSVSMINGFSEAYGSGSLTYLIQWVPGTYSTFTQSGQVWASANGSAGPFWHTLFATRESTALNGDSFYCFGCQATTPFVNNTAIGSGSGCQITGVQTVWKCTGY